MRGRETRREWKGDVEATLRPAFDMRHSFRLGYTHADVLDSVVRMVPTYFTEGDARIDYFSIGYSFVHDQRDNRVYPLSGTFTMFRTDHYGLPVLGDDRVDLTTFYGAVQRSWRTSERWSIGGSLRSKVSIGPELPYYMQQGLGYDDYVRGYEYDVIDGEHYALFKANALWALVEPREYIFTGMKNDNFKTLYLAVYLNAFADFGRVWDSRYAYKNPLANRIQQGYGIGVNVVTSYDQVMRVEFAVNGRAASGFYLHFAQPF